VLGPRQSEGGGCGAEEEEEERNLLGGNRCFDALREGTGDGRAFGVDRQGMDHEKEEEEEEEERRRRRKRRGGVA